MATLTISPQLTLHYLDVNPGGSPPVLLLHGLGATGQSWRMQIPALQEAGYRILAPDARGFGESTYPGGGMSVAQMAADMVSLIQQLGTTPIHVVGISMGGTLAIQLALDHKPLVDKLVLVNTFARLRPEGLSGWVYFAFRLVLVHTLGIPTQAKAVTQRIFPHADQEELRQQLYDQILQADPHAYRAAMRALMRFNVQARLGEIRAPTLVITGENDTTVPPKNQRILAESIPNAKQVVIPHAGHGVIADHPQAFNRALLEFIE